MSNTNATATKPLFAYTNPEYGNIRTTWPFSRRNVATFERIRLIRGCCGVSQISTPPLGRLLVMVWYLTFSPTSNDAGTKAILSILAFRIARGGLDI
jgi:hypothetical protein